MTRPGIFGILQTYRALLGHGVPNQKYDSHFSYVTPRGLFLVNPTRGHCFLISFSPGCYDFRVVFCFDFLHLRLVQLFHNQFILNQPNKPEPKQRAEPLNFALPGEQGLEEHSTGFSGVGVECSGALLSGASRMDCWSLHPGLLPEIDFYTSGAPRTLVIAFDVLEKTTIITLQLFWFSLPFPQT